MRVAREIESGELSKRVAKRKYGIQEGKAVTCWLRKYGTFDWENQIPSNMPRSQEQKLMELEQMVKLLEKQKASLERQVEVVDKKAIIFDMMISIVEREYPDQKKMLTRTIDHYREGTKETLFFTCGLFGANRQVYYRR